MEHSSARAAQILKAHGYRDVYPLEDGMNAWRDLGYPLAPKDEEMQSLACKQLSVTDKFSLTTEK